MTEPIYVKCRHLIYALTMPRYKELLESLSDGAEFAFEADELIHKIAFDLDRKDPGEEAALILASRELSDLCEI